MAKSTQETIELGRLIRRSEAARLQIGIARARLKRKLDLPSRIKDSVTSEPLKWLGGSAAAGFVGSFLIGSKKKRSARRAGKAKRKSRAPLGTLKFLVKIAKPAAKIYMSKLIKDYLEARLRNGIASRRGIRHSPEY